jgi:hypothetical protein
MPLVLQCHPRQSKEHEEEEHLDAQVFPFGYVVLGQAIVLQKLQSSVPTKMSMDWRFE